MLQLSLCVTTYNRLPDLRRLVGQLLQLQRPAGLQLEIFIQDDSTDPATEQWYHQTRPAGIGYHRNARNLGQFANCNAALHQARGEWVQIIHDDDEINPDYLLALSPYLAEPGLVLLTGRSRLVGTNAARIQYLHDARLERTGFSSAQRLPGPPLAATLVQHGCPFIFSHTLFRRTEALAAGGFRQSLRLIGDFDLWLRLLQRGACQMVDAEIGRYHLHAGNQVANRAGRWQFFLESMCQHLFYLDYVATHDPAWAPAFRAELARQLPKGRFISEKLLRYPLLARRLRTLSQRHALPAALSLSALPYYILNALPVGLSAGLYRRLLRLPAAAQ